MVCFTFCRFHINGESRIRLLRQIVTHWLTHPNNVMRSKLYISQYYEVYIYMNNITIFFCWFGLSFKIHRPQRFICNLLAIQSVLL